MARICLDKQRMALCSDLIELLAVVVTICGGAVLGLLLAIHGWDHRFEMIAPIVVALALAVWLAATPHRKHSIKSADGR